MKNTPENKGYIGAIRLLRDKPEWAPIIAAAVESAKTIKGGFAGSWVLDLAKQKGVSWIPGLRTLVAYGILQKEGASTRGGRRAYYTMPDVAGVEQALNEIQVPKTFTPYAGYQVGDSGVIQATKVRIPFFANLAACGGPNMSEAVVDDYIDVDTRLARPGHQYYLVRADGDSMDLAGIHSGDFVLVRVQNHADVGQKVVASLADGVTIKELQYGGDHIILMPRSSNTEHKPMVLKDNVAIQGVVIGTIPGFK